MEIGKKEDIVKYMNAVKIRPLMDGNYSWDMRYFTISEVKIRPLMDGNHI